MHPKTAVPENQRRPRLPPCAVMPSLVSVIYEPIMGDMGRKAWHRHLSLRGHQIPQRLCPQQQEAGSSTGTRWALSFPWGSWGCSLPQP